MCGVWCRRAAGCRVGRPFSGGRHGRVAFSAHALRFRRAFPACARRASGAGDAVNGKYEKKTVTVRMATRADPIICIRSLIRFVYLGVSRRYQPWIG